MLTDKQRGVVFGILPAYALTFANFGFAILSPPAALLPAGPFPAGLSIVLASCAVPAACVAGNIGAMANHRFSSPQDIDGSGLTVPTPKARILQATLQNTLEQAVIATLAWLAFAATMPVDWQAAVPLAALQFAVGRALFWNGYLKGAGGRALGFGLTFYPSMLMLLAVLVRIAWNALA